MKFSVVIPVFNEDQNLRVLHGRLTKVMKGLDDCYEIVYVDDGSTDGSFPVLQQLHEADSKTRVIRFTRNFGQHTALTAGLDYCRGDNVIVMDADLQDQPEEIPKLIGKLNEGYDIVYGVRRSRRDSLFKKLSSKAYLWCLAKLTNQTINPEIATFRVMTRRVVGYVGQLRERSRFWGGLVAWLGFPYALVDVEHGRRFGGKTKYSLWKMIRLGTEGAISFSDVPLQLIVYFGLLVSTTSFVLGLYVLGRQLIWDIPVAGYTSLIVTVFFTGGMTLLVLGIVGQYVGRIHVEVKNRPLYVVRDMLE